MWLYNGRLMPPGSQTQHDKAHPEAWHRRQMGIGRTEYSSAESDYPVSKLTGANAKGDGWRSRTELWIEDIERYWPVVDSKMTAMILKEMRDHIQLHSTESSLVVEDAMDEVAMPKG